VDRPDAARVGLIPAAGGTPEKRLRYYARQFGLVEVDATCYALPAEQTAMAWAARTPAGFAFTVKGSDLAGVYFDDIFPHGPEQAQELVLFGFPDLEVVQHRDEAFHEGIELAVRHSQCWYATFSC
jgi:hypothetical protein